MALWQGDSVADEDALDQLLRDTLGGERTRALPPRGLWQRVRQEALARRLAAQGLPLRISPQGATSRTQLRAGIRSGLWHGPDR